MSDASSPWSITTVAVLGGAAFSDLGVEICQMSARRSIGCACLPFGLAGVVTPVLTSLSNDTVVSRRFHTAYSGGCAGNVTVLSAATPCGSSLRTISDAKCGEAWAGGAACMTSGSHTSALLALLLVTRAQMPANSIVR